MTPNPATSDSKKAPEVNDNKPRTFNPVDQAPATDSPGATPSQGWVVSWLNERPMRGRNMRPRKNTPPPPPPRKATEEPAPVPAPAPTLNVANTTVTKVEPPKPPVEEKKPEPPKPVAVAAEVPVVVKGEAPGVKDGGKFEATKTVAVSCLPADKPAAVEVDVSKLQAGQSICVKDLAPIKGVTFTGDKNSKVAACSEAPKPSLKIGATTITLILPPKPPLEEKKPEPPKPVAVASEVPVVVKGEAPGVKDGGKFEATKTVAVSCLPADKPAAVEVDVSKLQAGQSICVKDLAPIKGVTFTGDKNSKVATCSEAPKPSLKIEKATITRIDPPKPEKKEEPAVVVIEKHEDAPKPAEKPQEAPKKPTLAQAPKISLAPKKPTLSNASVAPAEEEPTVVIIRYDDTPAPVTRPKLPPKPPVAPRPAPIVRTAPITPPAVIPQDDGKVPMKWAIIDAIVCAIAAAAFIFLLLEFMSRVIK